MDPLEAQSDLFAGSANNTYKNTMNWTEPKTGGEYKTMLFMVERLSVTIAPYFLPARGDPAESSATPSPERNEELKI